jgi:hypothetical protein
MVSLSAATSTMTSTSAEAPIAFYASGRYANVRQRPNIVRALATASWAAQRKTCLGNGMGNGLHDVDALPEVLLLDTAMKLAESSVSVTISASYSTPDWNWSRHTSSAAVKTVTFAGGRGSSVGPARSSPTRC